MQSYSIGNACHSWRLLINLYRFLSVRLSRIILKYFYIKKKNHRKIMIIMQSRPISVLILHILIDFFTLILEYSLVWIYWTSVTISVTFFTNGLGINVFKNHDSVYTELYFKVFGIHAKLGNNWWSFMTASFGMCKQNYIKIFFLD